MSRRYRLITVLIIVILACLVLTACSPQQYHVQFDANGGEGSSQIQTFDVGQTADLFANPFTKPNYDFVGWSTDKNANTATYLDKQSVTDLAEVDQTITLYAVWSPKPYTVTFDSNGGQGSMLSQQMPIDTLTALSKNAFTKEGHSFVGWALQSDAKVAQYTDGQSVINLASANGNVTLYALWQKLVYTINYDGNGATSGTMYAQNVACGKETTLAENTFSRGYKHDFVGWSTDKNATTATYFDKQSVTDIVQAGQTITLYAVWKDWIVPSRQPQTATDLVVEDANDKGNSDLQSDWVVQAYNNSWKETTATIQLVSSGYDNTNCAKLNYWNNTTDFRYGKGYATTNDYDTLTFDFKGNGISEVRISIAHTTHGVYATYSLGVAPAVWTHYEISIFDENWSLEYGGKKISIEEGIKMMDLTGYYDVIKWFDTFRITLKGSTPNGANAYAYLDNVTLRQTKSTQSTTQPILYDFGGTYTTELSDGTVVKAVFSPSQTANKVEFQTLNLQQNVALSTQYTQQGSAITFTGDLQGSATISGNGEQLTIASLSGANSLLDNATFSKVYLVDDFESYTKKSTGLDANNGDISQVDGLRGGYYAEYYSNNTDTSALVGGIRWCLMDDDVNYADLSSTAHESNQAMQLVSLKNGNARYISMSMVKGGAMAIGKGSTLGFWVKNVSSFQIKIRQAYVSYRDTVTNSNVTNSTATSYGTAKSFTISANSQWTFCEIPVDPTKDVYGVILVLQENYTANGYLLIDDVTLYSANPFASYSNTSDKPQMPEFANVNLDFQSQTVGSDYFGSDWTCENLRSSGWVAVGGQIRVRQNVANNTVLNMYTCKDNCYRYTYVGQGVGLGKANYFSIDLGNYYQTPSDVQVKIMIVDADDAVLYLLGSTEQYYTLTSTKGANGEQNLTTFSKTFQQTTVKRIIIELKGTNGNQYVYMDNVKLQNVSQ